MDIETEVVETKRIKTELSNFLLSGTHVKGSDTYHLFFNRKQDYDSGTNVINGNREDMLKLKRVIDEILIEECK